MTMQLHNLMKLKRRASTAVGVARAAQTSANQQVDALERHAADVAELAPRIERLARASLNAHIAMSQMASDGHIDPQIYPGAAAIIAELRAATDGL